VTAAAGPVRCTRHGCGHPYTSHAPGGAHCRVEFSGLGPCLCPGFQWIDPTGTGGGYATPPNPYDYGLLPDGTPDLGDSEG
jgi:hypothetical protein